jgi:glycosyltransferase involved in cell wall biosynthesis
MKLSIIIPTLVTRREFRAKLIAELRKQVAENDLHEKIELLIYEDVYNHKTTGAKRQECLEKATGEYICCIDDDDRIAPTYLIDVLEAMKTRPDVITFDGEFTVDGRSPSKFHIGLEVKNWGKENGVYMRYPHHLCPIRADIAKRGKYPDRVHGEDVAFANTILHLLKTSVHIKKDLYFYDWVSIKIQAEPPKSGRGKHLQQNQVSNQRLKGRVITRKK